MEQHIYHGKRVVHPERMVAGKLTGDVERARNTVLPIKDVCILERKAYDAVSQRCRITIDPLQQLGQLW